MIKSTCQLSTYRLKFYEYPYDTALCIGAQHLLWGQTRLGNKMSHRRGILFLRRLYEKVIFAKAIPGVSQIAFRHARRMKTYPERLEWLEQTNRHSSEHGYLDSSVCFDRY